MKGNTTKLLEKQLDKREAIIKAAIEVFSYKGFHKAKISHIAKLADVADGTMYLYFKNKEHLLVSAFDELTENILIDMKSTISLEKTALDRLSKFIDLHVDIFTEKPEIARFLAIELRQSPDFYESYPAYNPLKEYISFIEILIIDAIEEKSIRAIDPKALTLIIFGTIDFLLTEWSTKNQSFLLQEMKDKIVDIIRWGIRV
ncbi:MAG: TetR/AcrR family transcriptional regulator [Candidatus Tenebribacter davisii]|jgi:TetR/AcrR family fatty acid metabolism transcriptional regulator|nr:TetR/AcrR family transcriptional regulator [Candidatus Tenebribacter davisii]